MILARTNMGALVESWLKFFYCVYYEDYMKNPLTQNKKGKTITVEPNNMRFEDLKNFSKGILWDDEIRIRYSTSGLIRFNIIEMRYTPLMKQYKSPSRAGETSRRQGR